MFKINLPSHTDGFSPLAIIVLKSLKFRLWFPYGNRGDSISGVSSPFSLKKKKQNTVSLIYLAWIIEKRDPFLQRARGLQLKHKYLVHNCSSTQLSGVWGDSILPFSVYPRQAKPTPYGTGLLNQVTMVNSIFSSFSKDCSSTFERRCK